MEEFLVKLSSGSYFSKRIGYTYVKAPSLEAVRSMTFSNEDGELEIEDIQLVTKQLVDNIYAQIDAIHQQLQLFPLDERQVALEQEAYDLRQQLEAILDSEIAWRG